MDNNNSDKKEKDESTEMAILNAASTVFMEKGFEGTRMQEIADNAEINKALLHYYYRSKKKLFYAVFTVVFKDMINGIVSIFEEDRDIFDSISLFFERHQELLLKNKDIPVFILNELHRDPDLIINMFDTEKLKVVRESFFDKVLIEQENGTIRKDINILDLFMNILSLSVFPFAAKPLITGMFSITEESFKEMIYRRKENLADFVINSIKVK